MSATFREEFPDFLEADMPQIPEGFKDASWGNDSCPRFVNAALRLVIFVDFAKPEDREFPECQRFSIHHEGEGLAIGDQIVETTGVCIFQTDEWSDIEAFVEKWRS